MRFVGFRVSALWGLGPLRLFVLWGGRVNWGAAPDTDTAVLDAAIVCSQPPTPFRHACPTLSDTLVTPSRMPRSTRLLC